MCARARPLSLHTSQKEIHMQWLIGILRKNKPNKWSYKIYQTHNATIYQIPFVCFFRFFRFVSRCPDSNSKMWTFDFNSLSLYLVQLFAFSFRLENSHSVFFLVHWEISRDCCCCCCWASCFGWCRRCRHRSSPCDIDGIFFFSLSYFDEFQQNPNILHRFFYQNIAKIVSK